MAKLAKTILFLFLLSLPVLGLAQRGLEITYPTVPGIPGFALGPTISAQDVANYIQYLFYFAILTGIILALAILVLAGFRYLYSTGNPKIQAEAKSQIINAFVGLILLLVSLTLLNSIRPEFAELLPVQMPMGTLVVNALRRIRITMSWQEIVTRLEPTAVPLELTYPTAGGFRPEFIPFVTPIAPHLYSLEKLVARYGKYLYDFSFMIGIILALLFLIIGGVRYLTSAGNIAQASDARDQIFASLLGLILLLASYLILIRLRPEFALINPAELEEIEIELEPGVYLCSTAMNQNENQDLLVRVCRCRDFKALAQTYGDILPDFRNRYNNECRFPKRMKKEIYAFVSTQCFLIQNSETLPPWLIGEPVDIEKVEEKLEELRSEGLITDDEYNEIVQEWEEYNAQIPQASFRTLYINGPYGLILHEERDFKGRGEIIMKHNFSGGLMFGPPPDEFITYSVGVVHNLDFGHYYHYRHEILNEFRSVTFFEDKVADCVLKTRPDGYFVNITDCVEIRNLDDITFVFYNTPDFGTLEERVEELGLVVIDWSELNITPFGRGNLRTLAEGAYQGNIDLYHLLQNPIYSLKLPAEEKWVVVVGVHLNRPNEGRLPARDFPRLYVLNKSERDFGSTYVRSFCQRLGIEYPCITHFFAYPGKIVRER